MGLFGADRSGLYQVRYIGSKVVGVGLNCVTFKSVRIRGGADVDRQNTRGHRLRRGRAGIAAGATGLLDMGPSPAVPVPVYAPSLTQKNGSPKRTTGLPLCAGVFKALCPEGPSAQLTGLVS